MTYKVEKITFRHTISYPSTTYATFGLYRYPAKFIPQVVAYVLENYATRGARVFDPFGGYGTTGIVSRIYGCPYELWDLNPLIELFHEVAISSYTEVDIDNLLKNILDSNVEFHPDWSGLSYWYPERVIPFLCKVWGFYHYKADRKTKLILAIPLLKVTRLFSFDDIQRQKLSRSSRSIKRALSLAGDSMVETFSNYLRQKIKRVIESLVEYKRLNPQTVKYRVKGGVDTLTQELREEKDILITSPPYLQSQEYIRQAKMDLFWLGFPERAIKELARKEIPYRKVPQVPVFSRTYEKYRAGIVDENVLRIYDRYFWSIIAVFSRFQNMIRQYMFIFVGHSSVRGKQVPIDRILVEHFTELGWKHKVTLQDTIVSRRMFFYSFNPATGMKDMRTLTENLVVLEQPER